MNNFLSAKRYFVRKYRQQLWQMLDRLPANNAEQNDFEKAKLYRKKQQYLTALKALTPDIPIKPF